MSTSIILRCIDYIMSYKLIFDKERRKVINGTVTINLSCKEACLLTELIKSQATMKELSYTALVHTVWPGRNECINSNNITQLVFKLRSKLKKLTHHDCVINIKGKGYQLSPDIRFKNKKAHLLFLREITSWLIQLFIAFFL